MVFTKNFKNAHISHMEIFNAGQPRLARYPVHWHHSEYVGQAGDRYEDPSSAIGLSIHDSFRYSLMQHAALYNHDRILSLPSVQ